MEAYVTADLRRRDLIDERHHLTLLAENLEGYRNLRRLASRSHIDGFYYRPRMDKGLLTRHSEGVIALSGCLSGEVPWRFLNRSPAAAARAAGEYAAIFKDRFYLELQHNGLPEQDEVNRGLIELARCLGLPLVATNDCHYLRQDDYEAHDHLLALWDGKTVDDENRRRFPTNEFHFKSPAAMAERFQDVPEALANTLVIAERCQVDLRQAFVRRSDATPAPEPLRPGAPEEPARLTASQRAEPEPAGNMMAASPGDLDGLATSAAGLAPFGPGNPAPVVALHAARVCHAATASAGAGRHLKMIIYVGRGQRLTVVGFDLGHRLDECEIEMDLILHLEFSTRTGLPTPYWRLLDFKPSETL